MAFDAGSSRAPLDYTLRPYVDKSGTIPEPSSDQIVAYFDASRLQKPPVAPVRDDDMTDEDFAAAIGVFEDETRAYNQKSAESVEAVTSGEITAADVLALPHRAGQAFYKWLTLEFRPEA